VTVVLSALYRYPVKSLRGGAVTTVTATAWGPAGDRRWMLVDAEGQFISQRSRPRLALLAAELLDDGGLELRAEGRPPVRVPAPAPVPVQGPEQAPDQEPDQGSEQRPEPGLEPDPEPGTPTGGGDASRVPVTVWRSRLQAVPAPPAIDAWLSEWLGTTCRLVHQPADAVRPITSRWGRPGEAVSLADGFPFLLTSETSLADLNRRLERPVGMERFRPNLVVSGATAFAEDGWNGLRIGEVIFRVAKPCSRCRVITVDPATGESGPEPLRTLATYRRREEGVMFGINLVAVAGLPGALRVGETVEILE
jgi:uncharacterized protein YcbX